MANIDIKKLFVKVPKNQISTFDAQADAFKLGSHSVIDASKIYFVEDGRIWINGREYGFDDDVMKELDATKWVFCGHDHTNNFVITEKSTNIALSYGMSMDYSAYPFLRFKTEQRGANVILINNVGEVSIKHATQDNRYNIDI